MTSNINLGRGVKRTGHFLLMYISTKAATEYNLWHLLETNQQFYQKTYCDIRKFLATLLSNARKTRATRASPCCCATENNNARGCCKIRAGGRSKNPGGKNNAVGIIYSPMVGIGLINLKKFCPPQQFRRP